MAAMVAHDALGLAGRAGSVENIERVGRLDRHAVDRVRLHRVGPVQIAPRRHLGLHLRSLQDDRVPRLVRGELDRAVEQGFVRQDLGALDAARGGDDHGGLGVVDPGRQLVRRKAAEHDRMHGADAGAGEHGDQGLRHHRHVDNDPVTLGDPVADQRPGEAGDQILKLAVGDRPRAACHRTVVDDRGLGAAPRRDMPVYGIEAGVEPAAPEPAVERRTRIVEHPFPGAIPVQRRCSLTPERGRIGKAPLVDGAIDAHGHATSPTVVGLHDRQGSKSPQRGEMAAASGRRLQRAAGGIMVRRLLRNEE